MKKLALESTLLFAVMLFTSNILVASVISTFDTDDDGWTVTQIASDGSSWGGQWPASWSSGYIYTGDVGSGGTLFSAPSEFLGDKSAYIGGSISFDISDNVADYEAGDASWNIMLVGAGWHIVHDGPYPKVPNEWVHANTALNADGWYQWGIGDISEADFLTVLSNLEQVFINADWGWGSNTSSLDNVIMHQVPEPMTLCLLGLGSLVCLRKRRN